MVGQHEAAASAQSTSLLEGETPILLKPSWFRSLKALLRKILVSRLRNRPVLFFEFVITLYFLILLVVLNITSRKEITESEVNSLPPLTANCTDSCIHLAYTNSSSQDTLLTALNDLFQQSEPHSVQTRYFESRDALYQFYEEDPSRTLVGVTLPDLPLSNERTALQRRAEPAPPPSMPTMPLASSSLSSAFSPASLAGNLDSLPTFSLHCNHTAVASTGYIETLCLTAQVYVERALQNVYRQRAGLDLLPSPLLPVAGRSATTPSRLSATGAARYKGVSDDEPIIAISQFTGLQYGGTFITGLAPYLIILGLSFSIIQIVVMVVTERETGIKQLLLMMGLTEATYIAAIFVFQAGLYFLLAVMATVLLCAGQFFAYTHWFLVFLVVYLFLLTNVGLGVLIGAFVSERKRAAQMTQIGVIIMLFLAIVANIYIVGKSTGGEILIYLISHTALGSATSYMMQAESTRGNITLTNLSDAGPLPRCFAMLAFDVVLYLFLAWYVHSIHAQSSYRPLGWSFLFRPNYWRPRSHAHLNASGGEGSASLDKANETGLDAAAIPMINLHPSKEQSEMIEDDDLSGIPKSAQGVVRIQHLSKVFNPVQKSSKFPLRMLYQALTKRLRGSSAVPPIVAVNDLNLSLHKNQILALLGHNGAGKTTTVSILATSVLPSAGRVEIFGQSLPTAGEDPTDTYHALRTIQSRISICPQHDVFLDLLTGYEHLELFMNIQGIESSTGDSATQRGHAVWQRRYICTLLNRVQLLNKADHLVSAYSGGMKRRLSVAFSLMGDPKLVLLDEPTTGMDVYSRKYTWDFIQQSKRSDRTLVLTSHSMEEADVLGDRVAVMSKGHLQAYGTSLFLKNRFGSGYQLHLTKDASTPLRGQGSDPSHAALPGGAGFYQTSYQPPAYTPSLDSLASMDDRPHHSLPDTSTDHRLQQLDDLIHSLVPNAIKHAETDQDLTYLFPLPTDTSAFPKLFGILEQTVPSRSLGIVAVGLSMTTLEEVFLKLHDHQ